MGQFMGMKFDKSMARSILKVFINFFTAIKDSYCGMSSLLENFASVAMFKTLQNYLVILY